MNESNEFLRATVVAHQAFKRLLKAGHSDAEARRMVVAIINGEESAMNRHRRPFDEGGFIWQMHDLSAQGRKQA